MTSNAPRSIRPGIGDVRDAVVLLAMGAVLGLGSLALHDDVPFIAPAPESAVASCTLDEAWDDWAPAWTFPRIAVDEVMSELEAGRVTIVDCRPPDAFAEAHIPGAISLPAPEAEAILSMQTLPIPPGQLVVAYCDGDGADSEWVGRLLGASAGCSQVHVLDGGWSAWVERGGPVQEVAHNG